MFTRCSFSVLAVVFGLIFSPVCLFAESDLSGEYKVLSNETTGLNIKTLKSYIDIADIALDKGDLNEAKDKLIMARKIAHLLAGYYRDINGSFRGLDALIPREMSKKNLEVLALLSKINLRLAAIHRTQGESELAVPLLVEVLRIMTPTKREGAMAYQSLLELGFVETPFAGSRN